MSKSLINANLPTATNRTIFIVTLQNQSEGWVLQCFPVCSRESHSRKHCSNKFHSEVKSLISLFPGMEAQQRATFWKPLVIVLIVLVCCYHQFISPILPAHIPPPTHCLPSLISSDPRGLTPVDCIIQIPSPSGFQWVPVGGKQYRRWESKEEKIGVLLLLILLCMGVMILEGAVSFRDTFSI